jgi:transposase-like protein
MKRIARKSDGRRIFTTKFRHEQIGRVLRGELTLAALSRRLGIARGVLQRWKRLETRGRGVAAAGTGTVVTARDLRSAGVQIAELQQLIGKQALELENLRAERDALKGRGRA